MRTTRTSRTFTHYAQENFTHYAQQNFSHHGEEIHHVYIELCSMKKERILQPRNQNIFASSKGASFHLTEGLPQKRKTTNTHSTEHSAIQSWWS